MVRGLSQTDLGRAVGMKQQGILNIEKGIVKRPRLVLELAEALGTTQEWLLWEEGPQEPSDIGSINELIKLWKTAPAERRRAVMRLLRDPARKTQQHGKVA